VCANALAGGGDEEEKAAAARGDEGEWEGEREAEAAGGLALTLPTPAGGEDNGPVVDCSAAVAGGDAATLVSGALLAVCMALSPLSVCMAAAAASVCSSPISSGQPVDRRVGGCGRSSVCLSVCLIVTVPGSKQSATSERAALHAPTDAVGSY
jgi:hypothetical protein